MSYERRRQRKIARNNAVLLSLGLRAGSIIPLVTASVPKDPKRPRRAAASTAATPPPRRVSKRQRGLDTAGSALPPRVRAAATPRFVAIDAGGDTEWAAKVFATLAAVPARSSVVWDRRRCHQHLTIAAGAGSAVATTGCAGYGAVVQKPSHRATTTTTTTWHVRVLRVGSGGWAVGVCAPRALRKPFKSLGRHPAALMLHSSGSVLHNRVEHAAYHDEFGERALITVTAKYRASRLHSVMFAVDDDDRGCVPRAALASLRRALGKDGRLELCCQPYKGGAAAIVAPPP